MNYDWQMDLRPRRRAADTFLPPAAVQETAWDILLALHSDERCELSLGKLGCIVSAPARKLNERLTSLEERQLICGVTNEVTRELRAVLTSKGRTVLDRYLAAAGDLQFGAHQ